MNVKGRRYGIIKHINPNGNWHAIHEIHVDGEKMDWNKEPIGVIFDDIADIHSEIAIIARDREIHEVIVVDENNNLIKE